MKSKKGDKTVIRVVRKAKGRWPHNHGSWKVAYADFVTAMMVFFLVMWIVGMEAGVRDLIEGYFTNPVGFKRMYGSGQNILAVGSSPVQTDVRRLSLLIREYQRERFERAQQRIYDRIGAHPELAGLQAQVEVMITDQGLRIELLEEEGGEPFFGLGSSAILPPAERLIRLIAQELEELANEVTIEGHTDALRYGAGDYSNWELSTDRANAARRVMEAAGLAPERIVEVRGYADRRPRVEADPYDPTNRRISIFLPFREPTAVVLRALRPQTRPPAYGTD